MAVAKTVAKKLRRSSYAWKSAVFEKLEAGSDNNNAGFCFVVMDRNAVARGMKANRVKTIFVIFQVEKDRKISFACGVGCG
jgi:hypothetical protein